MLIVDKQRPKTLSEMDYHRDMSENLRKIAASNDFPHILFYGPSGAGKKTRIMALLREMFGTGVEKLRMEKREFKTPSQRTVEIVTMASNYHIELNPSDVGLYDYVVVQEIIKEIAQNKQLDVSAKHPFKVVLLSEADSLSRNAQAGLRRTMEKYSSNCRLVLCCENVSRIIAPIRSRCLCVRVSAPTPLEVMNILKQNCQREGLSCPPQQLQRIVQASHRNLRRALLLLESSTANGPEAKQDVELMDWERFIETIVATIVSKQNPAALLEIRGKYYELLARLIPASVILKEVTKRLLSRCPSRDLQMEVIHWAAIYEQKMQQGGKEIIPLEAFTARSMALLMQYRHVCPVSNKHENSTRVNPDYSTLALVLMPNQRTKGTTTVNATIAPSTAYSVRNELVMRT